MSRLTILLALSLLLSATPLAARRLKTGPGLSRPQREATVNPADTIADPRTGAIILSGYEKTNSSSRETFFATNNLGPDSTVTAIELTLTYSDSEGRMLHRRTELVRCLIPPGETRALSLPTWDTNRAFHYRGSPAPPRRRSTPFDVTSAVNRLVIKQ